MRVEQQRLRAHLRRRDHVRRRGHVGEVAPEERAHEAQGERARHLGAQDHRAQQALVVGPRRGRGQDLQRPRGHGAPQRAQEHHAVHGGRGQRVLHLSRVVARRHEGGEEHVHRALAHRPK